MGTFSAALPHVEECFSQGPEQVWLKAAGIPPPASASSTDAQA